MLKLEEGFVCLSVATCFPRGVSLSSAVDLTNCCIAGTQKCRMTCAMYRPDGWSLPGSGRKLQDDKEVI